MGAKCKDVINKTGFESLKPVLLLLSTYFPDCCDYVENYTETLLALSLLQYSFVPEVENGVL